MTQVEYAKMLRTMHRIAGWVFIATIIFSPIGVLILRRGNRIYRLLTTPRPGHVDPNEVRVLEGDNVTNSLIMSWDDVGGPDL